MVKDFLIVATGSFFGGGLRFLVSKWTQDFVSSSFPLGTMCVNVIGCLIIGFISGMPINSNIMSPSMRLMLTTGFCGGFTTFSTFINENNNLINNDSYLYFIIYLSGSILLGMLALLLGHYLSKIAF